MRPRDQARGVRILAIFERRATPYRGVQRRILTTLAAAILVVTTAPHALRGQSAPAATGAPPLVRIAEDDLRTWLTTIASDAMGGRAAFTEGYGLAAAYVAGELKALGVEPMGRDGGYLQPVTRSGYRVTRRSSVTVHAAGRSRTFEHGDHVSFPALVGAKQTLEFTGVEFVGYGLPDEALPPAERLAGKLVVLLPGTPSHLADASAWRWGRALRTVSDRAEALVAAGAGAAVGLSAVVAPGPRGSGRSADVSTVERVDRKRPPTLTGDVEFHEFLLAGAPVAVGELRARASRGEPLEAFSLRDVRVSITLDNSYELVRAERTHNVVGLVPGSDPALRDTYVLFGAHLDHIGMAQGQGAPGRVNTPVDEDPIWNGADDDASGSSALLAIAKAMMTGPRPKRSALFVWHGAEEEGLLGSRAMADDPVVPLERIQAAINLDMIGRNHDDDPTRGNTLYVVGADRISTDLHNVVVDANAAADRPLTLDYFYNDPRDPESFYTRSDHYSYASRGIPAAFFFTGPHPDYHANTDSVDKILFPKLTRVTQLIYEVGFALADRTEPLRRDNRGPRSGRGFEGRME